MAEHLTRERIAALLDEPDAAGEAAAHLDVCPECASEFESMSRMRMALSGMPDLAAPADAWERIRVELAESPPVGGTSGAADSPGGTSPSRNRGIRRIFQTHHVGGAWSPVLTAAAVAVLFLAGLGVGRMLGPEGSTSTPEGPGETAADVGPAALGGTEGDADESALLAAEYPEYLQSLAELRELRTGGPTNAQIATDPALAAERIARLDALIEASREALRDAPADPALNDFLFDVVDERASVAGRLDQTIRQASIEY